MLSKDVYVVNRVVKCVDNIGVADSVMVIDVTYSGRGEEHTMTKGYITAKDVLFFRERNKDIKGAIQIAAIRTLKTLKCVKHELAAICAFYGNIDYVCYNNGVELRDVKIG